MQQFLYMDYEFDKLFNKECYMACFSSDGVISK